MTKYDENKMTMTIMITIMMIHEEEDDDHVDIKADDEDDNL